MRVHKRTHAHTHSLSLSFSHTFFPLFLQLESSLKSTEADLRSSLEKQDRLEEEKRNLQYKLDTATAQHSEEVATHKLTQEKLDMLKSQMNDAKRSKVCTRTFCPLRFCVCVCVFCFVLFLCIDVLHDVQKWCVCVCVCVCVCMC